MRKIWFTSFITLEGYIADVIYDLLYDILCVFEARFEILIGNIFILKTLSGMNESNQKFRRIAYLILVILVKQMVLYQTFANGGFLSD